MKSSQFWNRNFKILFQKVSSMVTIVFQKVNISTLIKVRVDGPLGFIKGIGIQRRGNKWI